jgi:hypothetical protein
MKANKVPAKFKIVIIVARDGTFDSTVKDVDGKGCHALQELFEGLGEEVSHRHTADWGKKPDRMVEQLVG